MADKNHWAGRSLTGARWDIYQGDALEILKQLSSQQFNCVVTSPPYFWLRDYGVPGQIGHEGDVSSYVKAISNVIDAVYKLLTDGGLVFLNLGDTYYSGKGKSHGTDPKSSKRRFGLRAVDKSGGLGIGIRPKSTIGIPWRVALEMASRKWVLRSAIIWHRKHALVEAVQDRPRRSYENIFMFAKKRNYFFNRAALRNVVVEEDVWTIAARPRSTNGIDTAAFPDELVERCLELGCPAQGTVLDPFAGSGTTVRVALTSGRSATGIDLSPNFCHYMVEQFRTLL